LKASQKAFGEAAVELGVVGHDHGRGDEGGDLVGSMLAGDHGVGDAGDAGDLLRDRDLGLAQAVKASPTAQRRPSAS
jgi:hypothetical protein